jgi:hypothetical protein
MTAYDGAHGAGAFAAALQTLVPEPASRSIALTLALALAFGSSSRRRASWPQARASSCC